MDERKLIDRQKTIDVTAQSYRHESERMTALQSLPVITEEEIRAKAIDEFAEKMKAEYVYVDVTSDSMIYGKYCKYINKIAEQLKEKSREQAAEEQEEERE